MVNMHSDERILVMIPYEIEIGFAIGRLIGAFYDMGGRLTNHPHNVHFSFGRVGNGRSASLPTGFANLLEFHPRSPSPGDVERLCAYVRDHSITSIFALDLPINASYLAKVRAAGVRNVISYWGAPMSSLNHGLKLFLKRIEVRLLHPARPDHFILESRAMQAFAVRGRGLPASATSVVHTGVDAQEFYAVPGAAKLVYQRFRIPENRRIIVYIGHLHERKGVHVLMQAATQLKTVMGRDDVHCLFLGNREGEVDFFREHCEKAASHITFGGYQSGIPALLSGCYAGCIPSTGWDSFPMSSIEMQACGIPVFVSNWQGVPETVVDRETGIVFPVGDAKRLAEAIASLVDDPERRARMSKAARKRVESEFTRQHQVDNLVACVGAQLANLTR